MKIIFFGTSLFAAEILTHLKKSNHQLLAVVTRPDMPKGRAQKLLPPPVKETALEHFPNVPIHQPVKASTEEFAQTVKEYNPDLFLVVAYGEIIKQNLLSIPPKGAINLHASLLPKYRGAAPIQRVLLNGDKETGMTVINMVLKMDAGEMLGQTKVSISEEVNFEELEKKLIEISLPLLDNVLNQIEKNTLQPIAQDEKEVTFAAKIEPEERKIDWNKSVRQIHNQIRAFSPRPGAWTFISQNGEQKRMKILSSRILKEEKKDLQHWIVPCSGGALEILIVQPEGKRAMSAAEYFRGTGTFPKLIN